MLFQKPAYVVLISCVSNVLILSGTIIIKYLNLGSSNSVIYLAYCNSIIPLIVLILFSIYAFNTFLKKVKPNLYLYDKTIVKSIFALGSQFFIIQIAGLVLFSTDTLLVAKFFSSEQVTIFNIVLKLFSIFTIVWSIVIAPYWVAFNEAYVKEDFKWINKTIKLLINLWVLSLGLVIGLLFFIKDIYLLWLKEDVNIPMTLSVIVAAYVLISNYSNIFAYLINGIGKIRLQLYTSVISACLNIPLAIYLVKYKDMGVEGVVVATSVAVLIGAVLSTIQCYKIINRSASGIWNK
ncbi:polysaccharide biosynthesis C-terminal domain-containing protein [Siphonobacter sp. SORGH_AS_1065]|uniref:polysaccharide biosynthesis C-terminal domain-containing protein n=1 Tax=Siphonobacter sp. SORGH_AS_1065 TaxID=3041795 RepID=UPI00278769DF|nr:polysaccharide biosynthesis C-terminal domain-containing protein [Siphonobacter sp. SORGH_AS_1065]MDQ1087549.1 O-antigen/teichoic acid export membrane protein [Siphonobacter sp. SORGH_AS_1065]